MENAYELKTRISLVMERADVVRKEYEGRNIARIGTGAFATISGIFSAGSFLFEKYEASIAGLGAAVIGGTVFYFINKNTKRRKEQLHHLQNRKSELEEVLNRAE